MKKPTTDQMSAELRAKGKDKFLQSSAEKRRMYHGSRHYPPGKMFHPDHRPTGEGIKEFKNGLRGMTFVSPDPKFSNLYAGDAKDSDFMSGAVYPVHVQVRKPFDFENADHLDVMTDELSKLSGKSPEIPAWINAGSEKIRKQLRSGNWDVIEDPLVMGIAKRLGFDGAYMNEQGVKNLGVFDPKRIKSAVGNRGTYDINDPDITKANGGIIYKAQGGSIDSPIATGDKYPLYPITSKAKASAGGLTGMATGGSFINSLVETLPFTKPVVNALGFRKEVYDPAELPNDLSRNGEYNAKLIGEPLRSIPKSTQPTDLPTSIKAYRADPTGKFGGKEGLETLPIQRTFSGGDPQNYYPSNPNPATGNVYTNSGLAIQDLYRHARLLGAAQKYGYPTFTPEEAAAFMLKEGRTDLGHGSVLMGSKREKDFNDILSKTYNLAAEDQNFLAAINAKKLVADRLGISLPEAWNGTGKNEAGQTGKDYARNWEAQRQAALHPKNKELLDLINRAMNEGKQHGLPLRANRYRDEIMQRREVPYANGGIIHKAEGGAARKATAIGINVASDRKAGMRYADLIVDGHKTHESRSSDSLRPYVGKRVSIVRTGEGAAKAIGEVTVGAPIVVNKKKFRSMEPQHLVPEGSAFDIKTETKHLYPMHDPVRYDEERDVGHGIIARKVIHKADGGKVDDDDYRGSHEAPGPHYGAPMHDVSSGGMYPADFYSHKGRQYYANEGWDFDHDAYNKVTRVKNKPNEMVSIYRAIPSSVHKTITKESERKNEPPNRNMIRKGDWVAINKEYAKAHGESALNGDYKIASLRVPARHVWTNADSIHEWGYHPDQVVHKADGGTIQRNQMDTPSLAQMRVQLNQRKNPNFIDSVGIEEAVDMDPKKYINPSPRQGGGLPVGGVADRNGLPVGGVDQDNRQPGQQMMTQQPDPMGQQQQQADLSNQTGFEPDGGSPQGPQQPMGNMLSMTPQGQALQAMSPAQGKPPGMASGGKVSPKQMAAIKAKMMMMKSRPKKYAEGGNVDAPYSETEKPGRVLFYGKGYGKTKGIIVPRHMWEGAEGVYNKGKKKGQTYKIEGMGAINKARAEVYGAENRDPLTIGQIGRVHRNVLDEHFAKPLKEQLAAENEALERLRAAKHIGHDSNTLDESEKLDTVKHERDEEGRSHVGYAAKGVAGHALYTSGHGKNAQHHIINTCPGQTVGCGGGHDANGIIDTMKGSCFAPNAESQYPSAAIRRACHEQAKHDPKMTRDWILAHTGSLRKVSDAADKKNVRTLFRPNVVDETDTSSRHVIRHLNEQRKGKNKPPIISNQYGKTNELHDPENGYYVTHSNIGPKVKHGMSIAENIKRDPQRIRSTISATDHDGVDFTNEQGNKTPPKGSYFVTDVKRKSPMQKEMEKHITHAKYWSTGRDIDELSEEEKAEGEEGHFDGNGKPTTPEKAHFGHMIFDGKRYDYQKQHVLHPRLVNVPERKQNKKTGQMETVEHMIPTDSRFMDEQFLPKNRFKTKNGKLAGHILMTTPTESTSNVGHETTFTHHVGEHNIDYAKRNNGEYEVDSPLQQALAKGKEYVKAEPIKMVRKAKAVKMASGGHIDVKPQDYDDDFNCFPERNYIAQHHLANRAGVEDETELPASLLQRPKD